MATVLEKYTTEEQRSGVRLLWAKGPSAKDIHKEMIPVYVGKCLSRKAIHNCVEKCSKISLMTKRLKQECGSG
jgi:hypothetical protein